MDTQPASNAERWPSLPLDAWSDTYATLHLWAQIVGKVRLVQTPWVNHAWHATLYVTARGLTTSPIPHGNRTFEIEFDFVAHELAIRASDGGLGGFALQPMSVAVFYARLLEKLSSLGLEVTIHKKPNEVPDPTGSISTTRTVRTTRNTRTGSGESSCRRTGSSRRFA